MDIFLCQALKEEFLAVKDDLALFWVMEGLVRFPALLEADSCGSFLAEHIRMNRDSR